MDNPVEPPAGGEYDPVASRLSRVEGDVHDLKNILGELKIMVARIDAQIPHLATKAEIAGLEVKLGDKISDWTSSSPTNRARPTCGASSRRC